VVEASRLKTGDVYDFACPGVSEKHVCACQVQCKNPQCSNAISLCERTPPCELVVLDNTHAWATLKRPRSAGEEAELHFPGKDLSWSSLTATRRDELTSGAAANRSLSLVPMASGLSVLGADGVTEAVASGISHARAALPAADSRLCGELNGATSESLLGRTLGIVALSYRTPATLRASLRSWATSGLLGLVSERLMLLNDPLPIDVALSLEHGFEVLTPDNLETVKPNRMAKKNVLTIGSAFYHTLVRARSDYVIFLEKDFAADTGLSERQWREELLTAISLLDQGIAVVRLRSRKDQGCGTFRMCENDANKPNWQGKTTMARRRNW